MWQFVINHVVNIHLHLAFEAFVSIPFYLILSDGCFNSRDAQNRFFSPDADTVSKCVDAALVNSMKAICLRFIRQ